MASDSDDEMNVAGSPLVSDSGSEEEDIMKKEPKKRKLSKASSSKKVKKKKKVVDSGSEDDEDDKPKSAFIEDMASESDEGGGNENDDDDDDEGDDTNEYEQDGFVVDDADEDEDSENDSARHRRRRKKKEKKLKRLKQKIEEIDDDDLMLVRENMGMDTGPSRNDSDDDDMLERSVKKRKDEDSGLMSRELSYRMFGDSDDEEEGPAPSRNNNFLGNDDDYDSDDIDEFIVDDDDENRDGQRRRRKQAPARSAIMEGPSVYQMDEAEELFGDMSEFLDAKRGIRREGSQESKKAALLDRFEPDFLKDSMMTPEMNRIRERDLPERYQRLFTGRHFPDAADRADESEWISDFITRKMDRAGQRYVARGEIVSAIDSVLQFYHDDKLEPAFVQRYCKEFWKTAGLHTEHLYDILDLDVKWDKLDRKRKSFQNGMHRVVDGVGARESSFVRECYQKLLQVPNEKGYQDLSEFLALDAPESQPGETSSATRKFRRPARRNFFQICMKGGLRPLSTSFTMNASVLGGILIGYECDDSVRHIPTPDESPGVFAEKYTSKEFPSTDDVMKGARHIAACKLAAEPNVRKFVRELYKQTAVVITEATPKGREDIDEFHYCHGLQYLDRMPVLEIMERGDMWLRLHRAEKEGLISIVFINDKAEEFVHMIEPYYLFQGSADEEWQSQRMMVLQEAINAIMVPSFNNELRHDMLTAAREVVVKECGSAMRERLMVRPYEPAEGVDPYVISIWVDSGPDALAHVVALDQNGELVDKAEGYCKSQGHVQKLTDTLYKFFQDHSQMHVVVINLSAGMKCMDMGELVDALRRQLGRGDASRFGNDDGHDYFDIVFLKDDVPTMYSRSVRAEDEFPGQSESVRAAIGLGRYLRNPASELCAMWGNVALDEPLRGRELLYLNLHPLQHSLVKDMLLKEYDRIFVQVINKFGVDVNLLANHSHTAYQIQFICGLGPIKGATLLEKVRARKFIERRQELLSLGCMGKIVYRNCAGFIRIRERDMLKESPLNPLDDTRIHPESYYMAVKMCGDANNNSTIDMYDPKQYSYAVEDTMFQSAQAIRNQNAPPNARLGDQDIQDALSELDLPAYAARLEMQRKGPKLLTLEFIKRELRYPYFDKREKYQVPKDEELFFLLNGETRETLQIGMIVPCTLISMSGDFARVRLQNGIRASIHRSHLPDYMIEDQGQYIKNNGVPKGLTLNAKILNFRTDPNGRFELELGCNGRSLKDFGPKYWHNIPNYAMKDRMEEDNIVRIERLINRLAVDDEKAGYGPDPMRANQAPSKRKKRQIAHPLFRNINCKTAMTHLREQPIGDVVIRPSTQGSDHLTLTWKMLDGVYRHFDIEERDKPSETRLGQKLVIKEEIYDSIDELIARFIDPMNELVDEVVRYKYFKNWSLEQVHEDLIKQKKAQPSRIPYILHVYNKFPGCFSITFIARVTPHSCHMEVKPSGFRFFGRVESSILPTLNQALQFFKMKALVAPTTSSSSRSGRDSSYGGRDNTPFAQRSAGPPSYHGRDHGYGGGERSHFESRNDRYDSRYEGRGDSRHDSRYDSRYDDRRGGGGSRDDRRYYDNGRYRSDGPSNGRHW